MFDLINTLSSLFRFSLLLSCLSFITCTNSEKKEEKPSIPREDPALSTSPSEVPTDVKFYHTEDAKKIIEGFRSPESIATDGSYFYVSNVGLELLPSEKDRDGFISKLDAEGNVLEMQWVEHLHAPKGMAIADGKLFVADVDKLKGYDLESAQKVFELNFERYGTEFLNDLTKVNEETLLLSATDIGYVFEVSIYGLGKYEILEVYGDMTGVNGLHYDKDNDRLLMAGFGIEGEPVGVVMEALLGDTTIIQKQVNDYQGYLDGIQQLADGRILFSDWRDFEKGGQVMLLDTKTNQVEAFLKDTIMGPADFLFDEKSQILWLPAMAENELVLTHMEM